MTTTTKRPRRIKPKYADPRAVKQFAAALRAEGVTGDAESAAKGLIQNRHVSYKVRYRRDDQSIIPTTPGSNMRIRAEVGDIIGWSFREDGTGNGSLYEVLDIHKRHDPANGWKYPHWGGDTLRVRALNSGTVSLIHVHHSHRKVVIL